MTTVIRSELPIRRDRKMTHGADWNMTIMLKEDDRITPVNTTGYAMTVTIKASQNGETYKTLTVGSGITHTPAQGHFSIRISAADVDLLDFANAWYDVQIVDASTNKSVPFYGEITMTQMGR